jgi:hypothetical protein
MTATQNNWEDRIHAWEKSGLSQKAYCRQEQLSFSAFYYWRRKLAGNNRRFVELKFKQTGDSHPSIIVVLPNDIRIQISRDADFKAIEQLVCSLKGIV